MTRNDVPIRQGSPLSEPLFYMISCFPSMWQEDRFLLWEAYTSGSQRGKEVVWRLQRSSKWRRPDAARWSAARGTTWLGEIGREGGEKRRHGRASSGKGQLARLQGPQRRWDGGRNFLQVHLSLFRVWGNPRAKCCARQSLNCMRNCLKCACNSLKGCWGWPESWRGLGVSYPPQHRVFFTRDLWGKQTYGHPVVAKFWGSQALGWLRVVEMDEWRSQVGVWWNVKFVNL